MRASLLALGTFLLSACGSGGGGGGGPSPLTLVLPSEGTVDGTVRSDGTVNAGGIDCYLGDVDMEDPGPAMLPPVHVGERAFVSFDLASVPLGVTIVSATLTLGQFNTEGDPYGDGHGVVIADHVDYGPALDVGDYDAAPLSTDVGTLSPDAAQEEKSLDVTAEVIDDLGLRARSQFRLRFSNADSDADGTADRTGFWSGDAPTPPTLTIRYRP